MKIGTADSQAETQSRPAARTVQFNLRNAWLRELERAQLGGWTANRPAPDPRAAELPDPDRQAGTAPGGVASCAAALDRSGPGCAAQVLARPGHERLSGVPEADRAARGHPRASASAASGFRSDALEFPERESGESVCASQPAVVESLSAQSRVAETGVVPDRVGDADFRAASATDPAGKTPDANPPAGVALQPRDRPWPARSVHMTMDSAGARVWIRDSALTQEAAGGMVSSLAGELALRGLRLRALTINGRLAFEVEAARGWEGGRRTGAGFESASPGKTSDLHSTFSEEVNRHGND
jgi:hypothetical protein